MADEVFDEKFFKKLKKLWEDLVQLVREKWILGVIFLTIIILVALFQQLILGFFQNFI